MLGSRYYLFIANKLFLTHTIIVIIVSIIKNNNLKNKNNNNYITKNE